MVKNILKIFTKVVFLLLIAILQGLFFRYLFKSMDFLTGILWCVSILLAFGTVLFITHQNLLSEVKLFWVIVILLFPILGILTYFLTHYSGSFIRLEKRIQKEEEKFKETQRDNRQILQGFKKKDKRIYSQMSYFDRLGFSIYQNYDTCYYSSGREVFQDILVALKKAQKFIFLEYFIISSSKIWEEILSILKEKANKGVEVRILYDDIGSVFHLKKDYVSSLEKQSIKMLSFFPRTSLLEPATDNRNHRKTLIVDGEVAFIGGINIADECLEVTKKYGVWKDAMVRIKGPAVIDFTKMFLGMWNANAGSKNFYSIDKCYESYLGKEKVSFGAGYLVPYCHNPLNKKNVASEVYLNIIHQATKYLYICTPYLIIDHTIKTALIMAVKRGVEVKIITPGIPDKKRVYQVTRSYYYDLLVEGVQIYEYTPGFLHAKCMLCDDEIATVGAVNLDYRSLYTHFENGCYFYQGAIIKTIKADFLKTIGESRKILKSDISTSFFKVIGDTILNLFAPLL